MGYLFTPRLDEESLERLRMELSEDDHNKIERGHPWEAFITDQNTKRKYIVKGTACSLPHCFCDAVIVSEI